MGGFKKSWLLTMAMAVTVSFIAMPMAWAEAKAGIGAVEEERMKKVEDDVKALQETQDSLAEEIGKRTFVGGYMDFEFEKVAKRRSTFDPHRLQLVIQAQPHDRIHGYIELKFERTAGVAADNSYVYTTGAGTFTSNPISTDNWGGEIRVEEVFLDFLTAKWLNFRAGIFFVPFGEFNQDPYYVHHELGDRPLVMRQIFPAEYSDAGVQLFGDVNIGGSNAVKYQVAVVNGLNDHYSATTGGLRNARPGYEDINGNKAVVGRLGLDLFNQLTFGGSGYYGDYNAADNAAYKMIGADLHFKPKGTKIMDMFELLGEYVYERVDNDGTNNPPSSLWGYYGELRFHFWPAFLNKTFLGKPFDDPKFALAFRYDYSKINPRGARTVSKETRYTMGFNYRPIQNCVLMFQYDVNSGQLENGDNNSFLANLSWAF